MTGKVDDFRRLRQLFEQATGLPAESREAFIEQSCGEDRELRIELERMLDVESRPDFLASPASAGGLPVSLAESAPLPDRIGRYEVLGLLGSGGFGVVYRAQEHEPIRRVVALKVIHAHRVDEASLRRFESERRTMGLLQHPGIAQIFEAGQTDDGLLFYAMELVDGVPITEACDRASMSIDDRLKLFSELCAAVHHAHQRGVIHRDLKPSNILVRIEEGEVHVKVIDFGIAKQVFEQAESSVTLEGSLMGTPGYMSPEQVWGAAVDSRSDVFSLGVLLYELLCGGRPFEGRDDSYGNWALVLERLREGEARSLSSAMPESGQKAAEVARSRGLDPVELRRVLRSDLEWVLRRALAKDPDERYASVSELNADIDRYRGQQPVAAREPVAPYLFRKFVRRNRVVVGIATMISMLTVIGLIGSLWALREVDQARKLAEEERGAAVLAGYGAQLAAASSALELGDAANARQHLARVDPSLRAWEWRHLAAQCDKSLDVIETGSTVLGIAWIGPTRVLAFHRNSLDVVDLGSGRVERLMDSLLPEYDDHLLDAENQRLIVDLRDRIELWSWPELRLQRVLYRTASDVRCMAISPDHRHLLTSQNDGGLLLHDLEKVNPPRRLASMESYGWCCAFNADGSQVIVGARFGRVEVRDTSSGKLAKALQVHEEDVKALQLSADGERLFLTAGDSLQIWSLASGTRLASREVAPEHSELRLSRDESTLYGGGGWIRGFLTAWDAETLEVVEHLHGHESGVNALDVSSADGRVLSADLDGSLRSWSSDPSPPVVRLAAGYDARQLGVSPDREAFGTVSLDGLLQTWNARNLQLELGLQVGEGEWTGFALGEERAWVCGKSLLEFDRATGQELRSCELELAGGRLLLDREKRWLLRSVHKHQQVEVYDLSSLELRHRLPVESTANIEYEPESRRVILGSIEGGVHVVDPWAGMAEKVGSVETSLTALAVSGDDLYTCDVAGTWFGSLADPFERFREGPLWVSDMIHLRSDGRFITGGFDDRVRVWDGDFHELLTLDGSPKPIEEIALVDSDEALVAHCYLPGSPTYLCVWRTPSQVELRRSEFTPR